MILYFSGVSGNWERDTLQDARVNHILVDPFDLQYTANFNHVAMDSGAYRAYKRGVPLPSTPNGLWDFIVSPDVINDPQKSKESWLQDTSKMPVWHWGESMDLLRWYLVNCKDTIGIGGTVWKMRERDPALWHGLWKICGSYPHRFHIFGANWLELLRRLSPFLVSADTSKWLDGARYAEVIDNDLKISKRKELSRYERCLTYASMLNTFFN